MKNMTVESLRKSNYKVRVLHYRKTTNEKSLIHSFDVKNLKLDVLPRGGKTRVELRSPEGIEAYGEALCNDADAFNRKVGLIKALGRAYSALEYGQRNFAGVPKV